MKLKKFISVVLAAAIASSAFSVTASAETQQITETVDKYQASGDSFTVGDFQYTELQDGTLEVVCNNQDIVNAVIPEVVNGITVSTIGVDAFRDCTELETVDICESIKYIESFAFYGCSNLKSVTIPKNVDSVGGNAFAGCKKLASIDVDADNYFYYSVDGVLFRRFMRSKNDEWIVKYPAAKKDKTYVIPNYIDATCDYSFEGCTNLEAITIPSRLDHIATSCFLNCYNLKDIYYTGTEEQWNNISINRDNAPLDNATIHYGYSNGNIAPVENIKGTPTVNSVSLTWDKNAAATSYLLNYSIDKGDTWTKIGTTKNTNYNVTDLVPFTSYLFRINACNGDLIGEDSTIEVRTEIDEVKNLRATAGKNSVTLKWDKYPLADKYDVCRYNSKNSAWGVIEYGTTDTSCTITGLDPDTSYLFDVIAYTSEKLPYNNGKDRAISEITVKTLGDIANPKATATSETAKLTWDKNPSASYYKVFVYRDNKWNQLEKVTTNSYTATKLSANTSYKFRVSGYDKNDKLVAFSDTTVKTLDTIAKLNATATSETAKLTWDKNTSAAYYKVFVYQNNKWNQLARITTNSYTATSLNPSTSYKYRVSAYNSSNKLIAYSDVTVKTPAGKLANLKGSTSSINTAKLTWSKPTSASYYKVFVYQNNKWNQLAKISTNSYAATKLSANTSYKFRVSAYNSGNKLLAYSDTTVKTLANVANLKATTTSNSAKLTWSKPTSASYYKVFVYQNNKWNQFAEVKTNSYTATKLTVNTSYKFRVSAYNSANKLLAYSDTTVKTK